MSYTGQDITDPSILRAAWQSYQGELAEDTVKEAKFDAKYEFDTGVVTSIESGFAYSNRYLNSVKSGNLIDPISGAGDWGGRNKLSKLSIGSNIFRWNPTPPTSADGMFDTSIFRLNEGNYMNGVGGNFPRQWLTVDSHQDYRDATQAALEAKWDGDPGVDAGWDTLNEEVAQTINTEETSISVYLQANLAGEFGDYAWSGNIGGRYVKTDTDASGTASTIDIINLSGAEDNDPQISVAFTTFSSSDEYFLPSVNFALELSDEDYLRLGAAKTITRPNMRSKSANFAESSHSGAGNVMFIGGGDPTLKPYEVTQFDLSYEHYGEHTSYSVGYYYKDITNFISSFNTTGPSDTPVEPALAAVWAAKGLTGGLTYSSTRPTNRAGGTVSGLEFAVMHTFGYLTGFWSGFGIQANYTLADSEDKDQTEVVRPGVPVPSSALEGFAENSYNLVGFYDKDGIGLRLAYNYRDEFLSSRSNGDGGPKYSDDYGQLDFSASYDINESTSVMFEATNLTDETRVEYLGQRDRVSLVELSGVRYNLGVRASF